MAEEKKTRIITSGSHYSIRANIDDRDRVTGDFVVIDDAHRVTQRVNGKGQIEPNACDVNCDYNGIKKAEGFKNGLATLSYTTPTAGRDDEYGGDDETAYVTRSGYVFYNEALADKAREIYENPGKLTSFKLGRLTSDYVTEHKVLLDVAQHSFEEKGREMEHKVFQTRYFNGQYTEKDRMRDLIELEKLAKKVVSHMAKEFQKANNGKSKQAVEQRIKNLLSPSAQVVELGE